MIEDSEGSNFTKVLMNAPTSHDMIQMRQNYHNMLSSLDGILDNYNNNSLPNEPV